jgi:RIC1
LFLHHILRFHLAAGQVQEAVSFASHYQHLVFFAHALEILLHTVVESEATGGEDSTANTEGSHLPSVIEFLDHFDVALDVVVGCARKTEMTHWRRLFDIVGDPKSLFEVRVLCSVLCCAPRRVLSLCKLNIFFLNADMPKLAATANGRFVSHRLTQSRAARHWSRGRFPAAAQRGGGQGLATVS